MAIETTSLTNKLRGWWKKDEELTKSIINNYYSLPDNNGNKELSQSSSQNSYEIDETWYEPNAKETHGYDYQPIADCEPIEDWQLSGHPNCNTFHQFDMRSTLRVINRGGQRMAFELLLVPPPMMIMKNNNSDPDVDVQKQNKRLVYKANLYSREISVTKLDQQRKDALVMERTVGSKFIPDVHGYCGSGLIMDFMPEGKLYVYIHNMSWFVISLYIHKSALYENESILSHLSFLHNISIFICTTISSEP